jgi:hypothetical protein
MKHGIASSPMPRLVHPDGLDVLKADAAAVSGQDRLVVVVGPAGTGKTTMLAAAVEALSRHGRLVFGVALNRPGSVEAPTLETRMESCRQRDLRESRMRVATARRRRNGRCGRCDSCAGSWARITGRSSGSLISSGSVSSRCGTWANQADVDAGVKPGLSAEDAERIRRLEQENRELRRGERDSA